MSAEMYEDDVGAERRAAFTRKRLSGKKLVLFVVLPILLLLGAAAGLYFSGALNSLIGGAKGAADKVSTQPARPTVVAYYPLPEILVNLRADGPRPVFLKLRISLELASNDDRQAVEKVMPRVVDTFQVYLRELRPEQLQGAAGMFRLREELLARVNAAVRPARVNDVLFTEMLVQ